MPRTLGVRKTSLCPHVSQFLFICVVLLLVTQLTLATASAQSATATLSGTVTDQNGAVIPGVKISLVNIAQGFERTAMTNESGNFTVLLLPPGRYIVRAERHDFSPTEVRDVILNVNDQKSIPLYMKVGEISQTVQIVDGSNLIDQSPAVTTVINRELVDNLPLPGRSFQTLITLVPGTVLTAATSTEVGQFSVNGQRADANSTMIDGVSANVSATYATGVAFSQNNSGSVPGFSALGTTSNLVSVEALEEFKVMTSSFSPEFGRTPGGQISIVTRSGGNKLHATAFESFRNDALDANDWFANSRGSKKAALRQNIFGTTVSGPIKLPRFGGGSEPSGHNGNERTFFFFSYEGHRLRFPRFAITDVPSLEARNEVAVPEIRQILDAFPLPSGAANANRFAEFASAYSDPSSLDSTGIRIDHLLNSKMILFGRYNFSPSESAARAANQTSLNNVTTVSNRTHTLTIGLTSPISAAINNEFRFNWSRVRGSQHFSIDEFGGAIVPPSELLVSPEFATTQSLGTISLLGGNASMYRLGSLADNLQRQLNVTETAAILHGKHQFKFGIDYRRLYPLVGPTDYSSQVNFSGVNGALTGRASSATILVLGNGLEPVYTNFSSFAQDTWKVNQRLALTYGVRWDINPAPYEKNGNDPAVIFGFDNPSTITFAPYGTPLYKTSYGNFAPRLGVSYQLSRNPGREAVLRGGFGIFYDIGSQTAGSAFGNAFPYTVVKRLIAPLFPLTSAQSAPPVPSRNPPATTTVFGYDPNLKLPRTYQWNLALEQSLGSHQSLSATYVGALGRKLLRQQTIGGTALNNPNFTSIINTNNSATSDYHALQIQFERRLSRGLQVLAFHSWAHSIDISSRDSATIDSFPIAGIRPEDDRGNSDFDVRHVFRVAATYRVPTPRMNATARKLLSNWSLDGIYTLQSAPPVDISYFLTAFNAITIIARPDYVQGQPLYLTDPLVGGGKRLNPAAFVIPTTFGQGSLGRNSARGFPLSQLDFAARREFLLSERFKLQFRAEFFNLFNHPNFASPFPLLGFAFPGQFIALPNFGRSESMLGRALASGSTSGLNPLYQIGGPRSVQLGLRLEF